MLDHDPRRGPDRRDVHRQYVDLPSGGERACRPLRRTRCPARSGRFLGRSGSIALHCPSLNKKFPSRDSSLNPDSI
jgi:hypothetical protein